jgi:hypothetical protein
MEKVVKQGGRREQDVHDLVEERDDTNREASRARTRLTADGVSHVRDVVLEKERSQSNAGGMQRRKEETYSRVKVLAVPARREAQFSSEAVGAVIRRQVRLTGVAIRSSRRSQAIPSDGLVSVTRAVVRPLVPIGKSQKAREGQDKKKTRKTTAKTSVRVTDEHLQAVGESGDLTSVGGVVARNWRGKE